MRKFSKFLVLLSLLVLSIVNGVLKCEAVGETNTIVFDQTFETYTIVSGMGNSPTLIATLAGGSYRLQHVLPARSWGIYAVSNSSTGYYFKYSVTNAPSLANPSQWVTVAPGTWYAYRVLPVDASVDVIYVWRDWYGVAHTTNIVNNYFTNAVTLTNTYALTNTYNITNNTWASYTNIYNVTNNTYQTITNIYNVTNKTTVTNIFNVTNNTWNYYTNITAVTNFYNVTNNTWYVYTNTYNITNKTSVTNYYSVTNQFFVSNEVWNVYSNTWNVTNETFVTITNELSKSTNFANGDPFPSPYGPGHVGLGLAIGFMISLFFWACAVGLSVLRLKM